MENLSKYFKSSNETGLFSKAKNSFSDPSRDIENFKKGSCIQIHKLNCECDKKLHQLEGQENSILAEEVVQLFKIKRSLILSKRNNPQVDQEFRNTCLFYSSKNSNSNPLVDQAYQEYVNAYHQITSIYFIERYTSRKTNLSVYDTESEIKHLRVIDTRIPLDQSTVIAQLPNGDLFCFGKFKPLSGITLIINSNYEIQTLPSGIPCHGSTAIYFNRSVYCFGGLQKRSYGSTLAFKFDLDKNRWFKLTQMHPEDYCRNSLVFNGNILISGWRNKHLWLYSFDIDSFSTIPFEFTAYKRKILAKTERVYLIECGEHGSIYESEIEDEYDWKAISSSIISNEFSLAYWTYNKQAIYIGCVSNPNNHYYKFNMSDMLMVKLYWLLVF